ncbi:FAD-dependent monooxygenase [Candidatus Spongiihabitans sp.]|uniref:FAD-dependent monooxygenase n=1 Tax=Candidatus Spongiihabitans sp. TaxID=3101308 RepID=UPI003C703A10
MTTESNPGNHAHGLDGKADIIIIGGGLVGASLAVALKPTGRNVLLVESVNPQSDDQSAHQSNDDERTVALTHSAKLIFSAMGIWKNIQAIQAQPILDIHISNRGHFGQTHLSHKDARINNTKINALGYVVPIKVIGKVLWAQLEKDKNTRIACPAYAQNLRQQRDFCSVEIIHEGKTKRIKSKLVVVADGGRSSLGQQLNHDAQFHHKARATDYAQSAVLSIVTTDRPHNGRAYERFTDEGPLALLPHSTIEDMGDAKCRYALVWTTRRDNVASRMSLSDDEFAASLQDTFGDRAGNFSNPSPRNHYPLKRLTLPDPASGRVIIIGNAAHTVHPVAGQGFNLGLRDVAELAEIIFNLPDSDPENSHRENSGLGDESMINAYTRSRKRDTEMVNKLTHGLIAVFSNDSKTLGFIRNLGLNTIEHCPPAKRFLLKRTMGLAGRQSKLALGIPLSE